MSRLLIDKEEHRSRVLKAVSDYEKMRKGTLGLGQETEPTEAEPRLFDGLPEGHKE